MRRWNGWGDDANTQPLKPAALDFLRARVGETTPGVETALGTVLAGIPTSRLEGTGGFDAATDARLRHARGQSFPDWIALRHGRIGPVADAVATPRTHEEAAAALATAARIGAVVVPYGGGTSVVGHLDVPADARPVLNLSLEKLDGLLALDPVSQLARFGAGAAGPRIESQLAAHGYMLGHFPQSWEYSTVGGWVVTRSSGQQSLRYGRIEQLFAGGRLATLRGEMTVGGHPASSAGPDLREFVLGSEGRLGLLTEAVVRIRPLPAREDFHAVFFPDWQHGFDAVRSIVQNDVGLSMLRLSNAAETETQLTLAGHEQAIAWLKRYLKLRGSGAQPAMLLFGATGANKDVLRARRDTLTLAKPFRGVHAGRMIGKAWAAKRYAGPYLRNSLWDAGYAADTAETAIDWPKATPLMHAIEDAARSALSGLGERVHVFTHLSHVYRQGCSLYSTFVFRAAADHETNFQRWRMLKAAVSEAIVAHGGTISHQHGVGRDHAPYLEAEKGRLGMDAIRAVMREFDPDGIMNPGKLIDP